VKFHATDIDNTNPAPGGREGAGNRPRSGGARAQPKNSIVDDIREPISGARTSTGFCNINIYDSFTKLI